MQPGKIVPMKLVTAGEVPRGDFVYQLKWDGVRMLAFVSKEGVVLQNRQLRIKTAQYPELQVLTELLQGRHAILDGEIVAPTEGLRTSFQSLIRRDFATNPGVIRELRGSIAIHYVVFDILSLDNSQLVELPLIERASLLRQTLMPNSTVSLIEDFYDGEALFTATKQMGLEGIVAKDKNSPYLVGERNPVWQKIKHRLAETFKVVGYTTRGSQVNALVLGCSLPTGGYRITGRAGSGLTAEHVRMLTQELPKLRLPINPPGFPREAIAIHPYLEVDIEFMEWTEDGVVRAPSIKGFRIGGEPSDH